MGRLLSLFWNANSDTEAWSSLMEREGYMTLKTTKYYVAYEDESLSFIIESIKVIMETMKS